MSLVTTLTQITQPEPGQDPALWLLGVVVILGAPAIAALFWEVIRSKNKNIEDWKGIGTTSTTELSKTIDSLRTLAEAVDRNGRDQAIASMTVSNDVRKLVEITTTMERRLERLAEVRWQQ